MSDVFQLNTVLQHLLVCTLGKNQTFLHGIFSLALALLLVHLKPPPFLVAHMVMKHHDAADVQGGMHPPYSTSDDSLG